MTSLPAPGPHFGSGHLHRSCRHAAVLPPLGLRWLRDAVLLSAFGCTVPVLHLLKTCVRVRVHVCEDGGTGGYSQETLGAPWELDLANRSEVPWAGHIVGTSSQHRGSREEASQGQEVRRLMAARQYPAQGLERQLPEGTGTWQGTEGMEPRSGSHLTSMSFFSSASSSFSDR